MDTPKQSDRREFMKRSALTGAGVWIGGSATGAEQRNSANERIQFACIGIGGKGSSDTHAASRHGEVVAICDVDLKRLNGAKRRYPNAKAFSDYRELLAEMGDKVDAVTVSTPDHTHAVASLAAMRMGKHCFTQKPLTHTLHEARLLSTVANEKGVATQMGNQGTASTGLREAAAKIAAGVIGDVSEVHVWTNRPIWPQGIDRRSAQDPPKHLKWDLWLGPAPHRPFANGYHPKTWRGWWDFGCGALGDMGCHTMNLPFAALDLRNPGSIRATTSGHNKDSYPKHSVIEYQFAKTAKRGPVKMVWYDGGQTPSEDLLQGFLNEGKRAPKAGALFVGTEGKLLSPGDYGEEHFLVGGQPDLRAKFTKSPGHFKEWVAAINGGAKAMSNFVDYSGPLTEMVLLGNLAVWDEGHTVEWDASTLTAKSDSSSDLQKMVNTPCREGWSL